MTDFDPFASAPADDEAQAWADAPEVDEAEQEAPKPAPKKAAASRSKTDDAQAQDSRPSTAKKAAPKKVGEVTVDVKPNLLPLDDGKVVGTFKGGSGFDAPWIVIHASSLEDYYNQISGENASLLAKAMEQTHKAGKHFSSLGGGSSSGGGSSRPAQQGQPRGSQEPPAGAPPAPGPDWEFRSGVGKSNGKPWKAWMPPRGSDEKPVFF